MKSDTSSFSYMRWRDDFLILRLYGGLNGQVDGRADGMKR
jgi:hypothetical protein